MALDRLLKDPLYGFMGVSLRRDNLSLAEGDMARALNADMHTQPGVLLLRKGSAHLHGEALSAAVRQVARHNGALYQVAGTHLYREFLDILSGLQPGHIVSLASYRPLNDTTSWTFIAQGAVMRKDDGVTVHVWGIEPPAVAPILAVGAAGSLTGDYKAVYTYARVVSGRVAHESNPSPAPGATALTADTLSVGVIASTDPQVTHIRVYRTIADGTLYLFDQEVDNLAAIINSSKADTALGAAVDHDNDVPPPLGYVAEYQSHFFGVQDATHPDYLWYARRFQPESWPSDQFLRIGTDDDPLQAIVRMAGFLGVFSLRSKYRVSGNASSGFAWAEALNTRGTLAPQAILATSTGVLFWAKDGIFVTNFLQADQELSKTIAPLFEPGTHNDYAAIDWDKAHSFSLSEYKRRLYAGYTDVEGHRLIAVYSQDTGQWYHYQQPCSTLYYDESTDQLLMGTSTGFVAVLEVGSSDDGAVVSMDAQTRTLSGVDRMVRKTFQYLKLDVAAANTTGGTVTLRIDGAVVQAIPVTSTSRTTLRGPIRLRDTQGYSWELIISGGVNLYGAQVLYSPLEDA